jgi:membrane protease YdiL (CAAX protease family)
MRIVRARYKALFIVGAVAAVYGLVRVLSPLPVQIVDSVGGVASVAVFLIGARLFRGTGEPVGPPRAWWRMTARPTLGIVLAILLILSAVYYFPGLFDGHPGQAGLERRADAVDTFSSSLLRAALYLNSSIRLIVGKRSNRADLPTSRDTDWAVE